LLAGNRVGSGRCRRALKIEEFVRGSTAFSHPVNIWLSSGDRARSDPERPWLTMKRAASSSSPRLLPPHPPGNIPSSVSTPHFWLILCLARQTDYYASHGNPNVLGIVGSNRFGHSSLERQRQRLPVFKYRDAILYLVENHATTIIVGETGSGKTTQIPQVDSCIPCHGLLKNWNYWKFSG
ncbi:hypothetical protein B296_00011364, partial [Ensete ventricosum]